MDVFMIIMDKFRIILAYVLTSQDNHRPSWHITTKISCFTFRVYTQNISVNTFHGLTTN